LPAHGPIPVGSDRKCLYQSTLNRITRNKKNLNQDICGW